MRDVIDLCGTWRFQADPVREGQALGYQRDDHDVRHWREVQVPCAFDDVTPELAAYEGPGWFRRTIELTPAQVAAWPVVHFESCNARAEVFVNGQLAGSQPDGFLPFDVPLHGYVRAGRNSVAVCVDNTRRLEDVPGRQRGWRPFGGILRPVSLRILPLVQLGGIRVQTDSEGRFDADIEWVDRGDWTGPARIGVTVCDAMGQERAVLNETVSIGPGTGRIRLSGQVEGANPWSPETPILYRLRTTLTAGPYEDGREIRFGFRTIRTDRIQLVLNGAHIRLRGFNRHEDSPTCGMVADPVTAARDLRHMKALGSNCVRLAHYPHDPATLDLCDEIGLLVMAEIPLYWLGRPEEDGQVVSTKLRVARRQLEQMVCRDVNHPSIVFWSVSNETEEGRPEVVAGNQELVRYVKALDPTRLAVHVTHGDWDVGRYDADDVICVNHYPSVNGRLSTNGPGHEFSSCVDWWSRRIRDLDRLYPGKPILVTECGYVAWPGTTGGALGEDTQAAALEAELKAVDLPRVCGCMVWCYADHPWPEEPFLNLVTRSPYGVVTRARQDKAAVAVVRKAFGAAPVSPGVTSPDNRPVFLFRSHLRDIPEVPMPDGFGMRSMAEGDAGLWEDIWRDAEPFIKIEPGLFLREFGHDLPAARRRCFFIVDTRGCAVGTISAWYARDYHGEDAGRIHWVAVRPAYQGKGLAKAALSYTLRQMAQWHERAFLATSTGRVGAIKLYLDFGFVPDLRSGSALEAWRLFKTRLSHPGLDGL